MLCLPGISQEPTVNTAKTSILWVCDSDIFYFFFCFGGGEREEESKAKRGVYFYLEIERGGGGFRGGEAGWCTPALGGCRGEGGGAKYFFFGAEMSTKSMKCLPRQLGVKIVHCSLYIYAVKLLSGPSLAILGVIIWAK